MGKAQALPRQQNNSTNHIGQRGGCPSLGFLRFDSSEDHFDDGFIAVVIGIDHEVVLSGVVDIGIEVMLHVTMPGMVFVLDVVFCLIN